jgi:hypothetical protein
VINKSIDRPPWKSSKVFRICSDMILARAQYRIAKVFYLQPCTVASRTCRDVEEIRKIKFP